MTGVGNFSVSPNIQIRSEAHSAFYVVGTMSFSGGESSQSLKLTSCHHVVLISRMHGISRHRTTLLVPRRMKHIVFTAAPAHNSITEDASGI
jgi:hypothetical protein